MDLRKFFSFRSLLVFVVQGLIVDQFYSGDRAYALETLMKAGGWKAGVVEPSVPVEEEGIRRPMADMMLLTYHLVFATYLPYATFYFFPSSMVADVSTFKVSEE